MNTLVALAKSKRTWVMIITLSLHFAAKYHVVLDSDAINAVADQAVLIVGSLGVIGTKVMDSKQAALPAPPQK